MFLVRLIYASKISAQITPEDIESILASARGHNAKHNITGILSFNQDNFLQCLEGSRSDVNAAYRRILNDSRHHDVVLLDYRTIDKREFSLWSMGYVPCTSAMRSVILQFSSSDQFDPHSMSGDSAYALLLALKNQHGSQAVRDTQKVA